jgi:AcrR family transcriptional regulator
MAQRQKEHVRAQIVAAATALFAEVGFEATTMAQVAERAGSSVGNVYKYFASKDALLAAVLPESFATELRRATRRRVKALGTARDVRLLPADARYHVLAEELLAHCIAHRERVVILLARAAGTPFASFADDFAKSLVGWALEYARHAWPTVRPGPGMRFALSRIYASYLQQVADALVVFRDPEAIRDAVAHLTAHHQGGLKNLFETAATRTRQTP